MIEFKLLGDIALILIGIAVGALAVLKGVPLSRSRQTEEIEAKIMADRHPLDEEKVNWHGLMEYCRNQHIGRDKIQQERFSALREYIGERFSNLENQLRALAQRLDKMNGS